MIRTFFLLCAALGVFSLASTAQAAVVRGGEYFELASSTIQNDDFYFAGNTLKLQGTTTGDVVAGGSHLVLEGPILGDVFFAGGRVTMGGVVKGDARIAGGVVTITGEVDEDVVVFGGTVTVAKGAVIHGDLLVFGDLLYVDGKVDGAMEGHVRIAQVTGTVGHDANIFARESLSVSGDASLGGELHYSAPREALLSNTAKFAKKPVFTQKVTVVGAETRFDVFLLVLRLIVLVAGATLLTALFPRFVAQVAEYAFAKSGWLTVKGFVFLFALPVLALISMVTIIGIFPGVFTLLAYGAGVLLAYLCAAIFTGCMLAKWLKKEDGVRPLWSALGAGVFFALAWLPVLGWLVRTALVLLAFGTLCVLVYEWGWVRLRGGTTRKNGK